MSEVFRHVGVNEAEQAHLLGTLGVSSADELVSSALPPDIVVTRPLDLPPALPEQDVAARLRELAGKNKVLVPMYGMGYWPTLTPAVIRRNVFENPAWYTAYTPYQPEISQGRLETLMVFQTMIGDLMGLPMASASLLDEATAVAEAVGLARRAVRTGKCVIVDERVFPSSVAVIRTRAQAMGVEVHVRADLEQAVSELDAFCLVVAQTGVDGQLKSVAESRALADAAHEKGCLVVATSDLLATTLITPPGAWGADVAVGSAQRFGIPLWYGGPAAGFIAVRTGLERQLPGRLVGQSIDADQVPAYRLALQTREQHIRREKATSNICTAQVLLAVGAAFYGMWHGPDGLRRIAEQVHAQAAQFAEAAAKAGYDLVSSDFFDTVGVRTPKAAQLVAQAHDAGIGIRLRDPEAVVLTFGEGISPDVMDRLAGVFGLTYASVAGQHLGDHTREMDFLTHPVFSAHRSETAMMRYMRTLADRDYALDRGMIPLGSCTMKLNPAVGLEAISLPGFADIHPYAPIEDTQGYQELMGELSSWLREITGYDAVSFQPNAGSQGELSGLLAIERYHAARGESRHVCLIPTSAHGTNAASAALAGMTVVTVAVAADGSIDMADLRAKVDKHAANLAAIMVTYPSTHGVYETTIREICEIVHQGGGQVYVDGANLNALVGLTRLGDLGADASHLNLHKTFAIPHGGGGPGVGPIAVKSHLAGYLPGHELLGDPTGAVASAPYGSAGILPISYAYIAMLGPDGLKTATIGAVMAANYISVRLRDAYPTLYVGNNARVAHECILDLRPLTHQTGITVDDVAKRLIDYGFHAPTMSFPVPGTLMVEPTESESRQELDRFCDAMLAIRAEIDQVAAGEWPGDDNPLCNAPHPAARLTAEWTHPYSREQAVFPSGVRQGPILTTGSDKYWPPVARIENAYGDRNLVVRL
ncbi:MAG: aminomethyl-transferring glycine dehydrogenase [Propionibacteriaceae bacterium]|nr:aminomethyl-transferring glycine dehydrogenase [Propionibacteriaceae bacterium]